jgi:AcrR family transcriptional regulator
MGRAPTGGAGPRDGASTRERVLDVALRLFVDQGYDKTSLREIAEVMGFSKAALYYHFASKDDILLGLHLRLHEIGRQALGRLGTGPASVAGWSALMQDTVDEVLAERDLLLLHERNHAALEKLSDRHQHTDEHGDLQATMRATLNDQSIPARDRVRLAAAVGAVFAALVFSGDGLDDITIEELGDHLRGVIGDVLTPGPKPRRKS